MANTRRIASWRLLFIVLGSLMAFVSAYLYIQSYISNARNPNYFPISKEIQAQLEEHVKFKGMQSSFSSSEPNKQAVVIGRTATDVAIVDAWLKRVGYSTVDFDLYRSYSDSILEDLSDRGDIVAMHIMEEKKLAVGDIDGAKKYAEKGIIYGSLRAIKSMADYNEPTLSLPDNTVEEAKPALIEALAYHSLIGVRGDPHDALLFKSTLIEMFNKAYNVTNALSTDDEKKINERTKELYDKYQAERLKLGLGDFDNDPPQEVKDFNGG